MPTDGCVIIGAGGHGKVVLDAYLRARPGASVELCDDAPEKSGMHVFGIRVTVPTGPITQLGGTCHVAIGDNMRRRDFGVSILDAGLALISIIHPEASVSAHASIGRGAFIAARAVVAPSAVVEDGVIVNHGAVVDHDCRVGAWSHIAPGSVLGGAVTIGRACLIGSGAVVLPGLTVGDEAVVGAGAIVTRSVPAGVTVIGAPAKESDDNG
jgi:sugar O-acyltransferase (sialic acid O-acetyltransferase NeuD family)